MIHHDSGMDYDPDILEEQQLSVQINYILLLALLLLVVWLLSCTIVK